MKSLKLLSSLAIVLTLVLTGCGKEAKKVSLTPQQQIDKAFETMETVKGFSGQMDMKIKGDFGGMKLEIPLVYDFQVDEKENTHGKMSISFMGISQETEIYTVLNGTKETTYTFEPMAQAWYKEEAESTDSIDNLFSKELTTNAKLLGKEEVEGVSYNKFELAVKASDLTKVMGALGESTGDLTGTDTTFEDTTMTVLVDPKTNLVSQLTLILVGTSKDETGTEVSMEISLVATFKDYGKVGAIEVPKEVIEKATTAPTLED